MTAGSPVVELDGVSKAFGAVKAVQDVTLRIEPGQIYGLLGPNGAGKTTLMRILLGLVRHDAGTVRVLGRKPGEELRRIGAIIESPHFVPHLSGRVNLQVLAKARGLTDDEVDRVLKIVDLEGAKDRRVTGYSLGMRQRLGVAGALLGNPDLLILDEPTNGLDPEGTASMRTLIREISGHATVLISSHLLSEIQQICERVVVLDKGGIVAEDTVEALLTNAGSTSVVIDARPDDIAEKVLKTAPVNGVYRLTVADDEVPALVRALVEAGAEVHEVRRERRSLEDVFFTLTGGHS
ncbi:ABC transporter ATP-binding protein [Herbidospora sp. RD11066]